MTAPTPHPNLVAVLRPSPRSAFTSLTMLGFAAGALTLAVTSDLALWQRLGLGAVGTYLLYALGNNVRAQRRPPQLSQDGLFLYRRPEGDLLLRGQLVPWAAIHSLSFEPGGVVWTEYEVTEGRRMRTRRDSTDTALLSNGAEFRRALGDAAAWHNLDVNGETD
ncbi:hypothetical protein [Deinococcus sp.]|uniref:hypothetical protein n=1 Tax=Deinococcus sp. TaxID=47478 RepID=UPI0025EBEEC7|nr:hypothetical protein [Deinococcus sp.]